MFFFLSLPICRHFNRSIHLAFSANGQSLLSVLHGFDPFVCIILQHMPAGQNQIFSHLCSHIDFRSSLNCYGVGSITQVLDFPLFNGIASSLLHTCTLTSSPILALFRSMGFLYSWLVFLSYSLAYMCSVSVL